jgi:hypothetical protein
MAFLNINAINIFNVYIYYYKIGTFIHTIEIFLTLSMFTMNVTNKYIKDSFFVGGEYQQKR